MIKQLSSLYDQIVLNEAEKSALQGTNNKVGTVPSENLFGEKPKVTDTGKVKGEAPKNLDHKTTSPEDPEGDEAKSITSKGSVKSTVPAKSAEETEGAKPKPKGLGEDFTMGAFETLFRKTLVTEEEMEGNEPLEFEAGTETPSEEGSEESEVEETEEEEAEEDLLTDLQDLQVRIADIITKLEKAVEEESLETSEDKGYSDEDFNEEFGEEGSEEESPVHEESVKNKSGLLGTKNVVGNLKKSKGVANSSIKKVKTGFEKLSPEKGKSLQKVASKSNEVKSSLKGKSEPFIK